MTAPRLINTLFLFMVIVLAVVFGQLELQLQVLLGFLLAYIVAFMAFILRLLTLSGMRSAMVLGVVTFGFGGWQASLLLLVFFMSGSLISLLNTTGLPDDQARRTSHQVWANGFWFGAFLLLAFNSTHMYLTLAALASLAVASADTWATEVGTYFSEKKHWLISTGKQVSAGTEGAISIRGSVAALFGSGLIAFSAMLLYPKLSWSLLILIALSGFLGSFIDSLLGAIFQYQKKSLRFTLISKGSFELDNNWVNALGTGSGTIITLILYPLFS